MKNISLSVVGAILLQLIVLPVQADDLKQNPADTKTVPLTEDSETPNAVILSINGKCEYSEDGVHFTELSSEHVFTQGILVRDGNNSKDIPSQFALTEGVVVRTSEDSRVDIFFRRIGTTVRLQADTEVKFEKMSRSVKKGTPVLETLIDLRKGRIFTVVRSLVAGSTFEIRNAAGRSVVEGASTESMGRYIITADGTQVADTSSVLPLKLIRDTGITIITPGQKFDPKEGKLLAVETPETVLTLIQFDEIHALAEAINHPATAKQPVK